jgi:hypothetical protein
VPKSEMLLTIVGLLGTFLLPWPSEPLRVEQAKHEAPTAERGSCSRTAGPRYVRQVAGLGGAGT